MKYYYSKTKKPVGVFQLLLFLLCLFIALATKAQTVESYDPADLSTNVPINKTVVVDFNQPISIDNPDADIYFFDADNGFAVLQQYTMSSDEVIISNDKLYINPDVFYDWPANTNIQMRINPDAITGWDGVFLHRFQIEDDERPTLTSTIPAFGETDVTKTTDLVLNFSENINVNSSSFIQLRVLPGDYTHKSIQFSDPSVTIENDKITISNLQLDFNVQYRVQIGAFDAIEDNAGYGFFELHPDASENFTFTTAPATPPQIVSLSPEDDAEDIPYSGQTFTVTFDEEIQSNGYIDIRNSANGLQFEEFQVSDLTFGSNSISFTPQNNFELGSSYYVRIQNVADLEGTFVENTTSNTFWNFDVEPATPPNLVSLTPEHDALEVAVESNLIMKFDEPVYIQDASASPNIQLYALDGSGLVEQFDLPSARVTGAGTGAITIDPTNNLLDDTKYYVRVNNAFEDDKGSAAPNITSLNWSFDTGKPPALTSFSPSHKAIEVPVDANLVLTFDEPMEMFGSGTSGIQLRKVSDGSFIDGINMNSSEVSGLGTSVLTIDPSQDLPGSTEMYVTISTTALEDQQGERYDGITDNTTWIFTTEELDFTAPTVETFFPLDDATDVSVDTDLTLSFDEPIQFTGTSSEISILQKSNNALLMTIPTNSPMVTIDGQDLNIELPQDLPQSTEVYVHVTGNIIEDLSDNLFGGISSNNTWNFTTETVDTNSPSAVSFDPANNAEEVAVDQWEYSITFDEPIQLTGTPGLAFQLRNGLDEIVTVAYSAGTTISGNTLTVNFNYDGELSGESLDYSTLYHIEIEPGYLEDLAGNDFGGFSDNTTWQFETVEAPDNDPPTVVLLSPSNGAIDVAIDANLVIEFSEDIYLDNDAGTFELRRKSPDELVEAFDIFGHRVSGGNNETTVTIDPTSDLENDTEYYFLIGGNDVIIDGSDNSFAGYDTDTDWSFITEAPADNKPPAIASLTPADEATEVASGNQLMITFNEDVQSTGNARFIKVRRKSDGGEVASALLNDGDNAVFSNNTLTVTLSNSFPESSELYIEIESIGIEDVAGNDFAGFNDTETWDFTTTSPPPSITSYIPADETTDIAINTNISVRYDRLVQKGTGNILIKNFATDDVIETIDVQGIRATVSGFFLTLNPIFDLPYGKEIYLEIPASAIESLEGVQGPAISKTDWSVTTEADPNVAITWNGTSWSNGTGPEEGTDDVIIDGNYNMGTDGYFDSRDLTVNSGATLTVDGESSLVIQQDLVNNGSIVVESGSDFTSYSTYSITGNDITFKRNTRYADGRYSFVGSPVVQGASITGGDLGSFVYKYNEATPYGSDDGLSRWEDASSDELVPGKGYTQANQQEIVFIGMPNQGTITIDGSYTEDTNDDYEGWMLLSNPYPAPIDVADFLSANSNTSGAIYIWDDNGSDTQRGTNADYIVANGTMTTNTTPAGGQSRYDQTMGSMQGFFVKLSSAADTEIEFSEDMRVTGNSDDHFFRTVTVPIARINLTDDQGLFKQTVIGLSEDATTTALNRAYDAQAFSGAADYGIYTLKAGRSLALNGMPEAWEAVQLQVNVAAAGSYTLEVALEDFEGALFLRDNQTGEVIDLKDRAYSFTTEAGIHTDRFELLASNELVLSVADQEILVYAHNDVLHINQGDQETRTYQVFTLKGQQVLTKEVNSNTEIDVSRLAKGMYLVFDGTRTHKVILK